MRQLTWMCYLCRAVSFGNLGGSGANPYPYGGSGQVPGGSLKVSHGAVVGQVLPGGPAAKAGLQAGDVVASFDATPVYAADNLLQQLALHHPGDKVTLGIARGSQRPTLAVTLGEAPAQ